jgi:hypothetical protein
VSLPNTFIDNTSRLAPTTSVGFKISKPGFNANTASGGNFIFNSSWPSLPIALDVRNTSGGNIPHGLKYPPFAVVWSYATDPSGIGKTVTSTALITDVTNVRAGVLTPPNRLLVFALDLSKDIDYALAPGDSFNYPYDNNYGVKFAKSGKDLNSKDLRDFVMHSRAQSPLILAVKTQDTMSANTVERPPTVFTPVNVVQYTNKGKSPTWNYGFIRGSGGQYTPAPLYSQSYPRIFTDGFTTYLQYTGADTGATLVILRDPMFAPTQVTVQY